MKSKTHAKKCMELGIVPVPVMVDDTCIEAGEFSVQHAYPGMYYTVSRGEVFGECVVLGYATG